MAVVNLDPVVITADEEEDEAVRAAREAVLARADLAASEIGEGAERAFEPLTGPHPVEPLESGPVPIDLPEQTVTVSPPSDVPARAAAPPAAGLQLRDAERPPSADVEYKGPGIGKRIAAAASDALMALSGRGQGHAADRLAANALAQYKAAREDALRRTKETEAKNAQARQRHVSGLESQALSAAIEGEELPDSARSHLAEMPALQKYLMARESAREQEARLARGIELRGAQARELEGVRQEGRSELVEQREAARLELEQMRASLKRRGGSGGGRGGGGHGVSQADMRRAVELEAIEAGMDPERARLVAHGISGKKLQQAAGAILRGRFVEGRQVRTADVREDIREGREDRQHRVPGFDRDENAPDLSSSEKAKVRDTVATMREMAGHIRTMQRLANEVTALEAAGASAGVISEKMGEAKATHEAITIGLRNLGNYGVPQKAELERMEGLAPRLGSVRGFLSAVNLYQGMRRSLGRAFEARMQSYGYRRAR